jgi:outer membrane receptor protein involved in Fe transport
LADASFMNPVSRCVRARIAKCMLLSASLLWFTLPARSDSVPSDKASGDVSDLTLEQLMNITVEGAALHPQTLQDAPASVTIITSEDIRTYGYRTLGEALASARGFYVDNNRTYQTVGVRGFNLPGDYSSRILVTVNGHNMADNVLNFMLFFGEDFPIEMNLVKRIEIIRGPSSALYGSNGVFATINIITKTPDEAAEPKLITDVGSFGAKKAQLSGTVPIGNSAKALFSASVFNNSGESPLYFPEFNTPQTNYGQAVRVDNERGYHFFANLIWHNWNITATFSDRYKIQPISWGPTVFGDRGTHTNDIRNYAEAAYSRDVQGGALRWRVYYDAYRLRSRFDYPLVPADPSAGIEENSQNITGDWVGTQLTYRFDLPHLGTMTAGAEAKVDLRARLNDFDISPTTAVFQDINPVDKSFALFAQDERKLSDHWKLNLGVRLDVSHLLQNFVAPRAALIYQPSSAWTYKLLYGRGFLNPSIFALYFDDGGRSGLANPAARAEQTDTFELDVEHRIGKRLNLIAAGYRYNLTNFLEGVPADNGLIQYQNVGKVHASGIEIELNGRLTTWLESSVSYAFQKSRDDSDRGKLENSPSHLGKFRIATPLGRKFDLSSSMQYSSSRGTLAGATAGPVYLADLTITSRRLVPNLDVQFGIRNAFNRNYSDPIALNPQVDTMQQPGRSIFLELIAHAPR